MGDYVSWLAGYRLGCIAREHLRGKQEPAAYTPAECIRFDGMQYVDTGIVCTENTTIKAVFERDNTNAYYLYGASSDDNKASVTAYLTSASGNWRFGGTFASWKISALEKHTSIADGTGVQVDGTLKQHDGTVGTFTAPSTLTLGCNHTESGTYGTTRFEGKVYSFQVYDGENLVLDYVPAVNPAGVYGFWDSVSKRFVPSGADTPFGGV